MKKKNITKLTILMMCLPYFTAIPKNVFAEETESSFEATETSEEKTQLSEEQIQQIEEEFSVPTLKKNRKKEVVEETTFEVEDTNEEIKMGPLSLEEDRNTRATNSIKNTPVYFPLGANKEMQEKTLKQSSRVHFGETEINSYDLGIFNHLELSSSEMGKLNGTRQNLKTKEGTYSGIEFRSNTLVFSSTHTIGDYVGSLKDYEYVVDYGETLEIPFPRNTNSTVAFTLHGREGNGGNIHNNQPEGNFFTANNPINSSDSGYSYDSNNPNDVLMIFELYGSKNQIELGYDPIESMKVKGSTRKSDVMNFFDSSTSYREGTIFRIFSEDKAELKKYGYNNGAKPSGPSTIGGSNYDSNNNIFYEFRNNKLNKISSMKIAPKKKLEMNKNREVSKGTSHETMVDTIDEFFTNSDDLNISKDKMSYVKLEDNQPNPETNKLGNQTTEITVLEYDEETKKEWKQTYVIPYKVVADSGPQMITKTRDIKQGMDTDELDATIKESFEESSLNDVEYDDMEFVAYPNTKELGKQTGKIKVINEESTQGNKVDRLYNVTFNVIEMPLEVEMRKANVFLGTEDSLIDPKLFIDKVYYDGDELDEDEYEAKFIEPPYTDIVGPDDDIRIKISLKDNDSISVVESAEYDVLWGHTLVSKDLNSKNNPIMTSISLIEKNNKPELKMTYGDDGDNTFKGRNQINIYRETEDNERLELKTSNQMSQTQLKRDWQPKLNSIDIRYGDVLRQRVLDDKNQPFNGDATFVSREEVLKNETKNYKDAYYEITKEGYELLRLNQLDINESALKFNEKDSPEKIEEQAKKAIEFPNQITEEEKENYKFELVGVDTSKTGKRKAKMNIYEKLSSSDEFFMISKEVDYVVDEIPVSVELQEVEIPVGTKVESLNPNSYVKKVVKNDKVLDSSEYTASFEKAPSTSKVGKSETMIKVVTKEDNKSVIEKTNTKVLWGDTIGSSLDGTDKTPVDASISLLHDNNHPYLVANEGNGLASRASSLTYINVYQNSEDNAGRIFYVNPDYNSRDPKKTVEIFNKAFDEQEFNYGDVIVYETRNEALVGAKLWASREEKLVNESVGYNKSFYEMTKDGYRLMKANEIALNDKALAVPFKTTHADMNKKAIETVVLPKGADPEDFRFEFASVDTASSGKKKTKLNIYEKLASGEDKEFKTTIDVEYIVNPQLEETFSDEAGKEIKTTKKTNFDLGSSYQPEPENFVTFGNELYMYKGWLKANEKPGTDTPRTGKPDKVTKEDTIHYIYEKSDKHINMTIPTEMLFGTENGKDVTSVDYEIKNNSNKVKTEVSLNEFKKETSEVKLLTSKEKDPTKSTQSARLNLTTNGKTVVGSLNDTTKNETITTLNPGEKASMGISGNYFGSQKESARIRYNMMLKFTVVPD